MAEIRVLVVDDFEVWRRVVCSLVQKQPNWIVVAEASDGLEAVQKAETLRPDLILLDLGLPALSGMEAARRIGKVSPRSKILVLSQESSSDVVQEALDSGALGYVYKPRAQKDLVSAIESVLAGKQFVSSGLRGHDNNGMALSRAPGQHEIVFCSSDEAALESLVQFIAAALRAGRAAGVWASESHHIELLQRLRASCPDVDGAIQRGTYVALHAGEKVDLAKTCQLVEKLLEASSKVDKGNPGVVLCGERAGTLWAEGKFDEAFRVEQVCNHVVEQHGVDVLCVYGAETDQHAFKELCAEHSAVQFR